jgi:hypothetical protein
MIIAPDKIEEHNVFEYKYYHVGTAGQSVLDILKGFKVNPWVVDIPVFLDLNEAIKKAKKQFPVLIPIFEITSCQKVIPLFYAADEKWTIPSIDAVQKIVLLEPLVIKNIVEKSKVKNTEKIKEKEKKIEIEIEIENKNYYLKKSTTAMVLLMSGLIAFLGSFVNFTAFSLITKALVFKALFTLLIVMLTTLALIMLSVVIRRGMQNNQEQKYEQREILEPKLEKTPNALFTSGAPRQANDSRYDDSGDEADDEFEFKNSPPRRLIAYNLLQEQPAENLPEQEDLIGEIKKRFNL